MRKLLVEGIVQGVGFRPFVYRIATELELVGYVRNLGNLVEIIIQGSDDKIANFTYKLQNELPPIAKINSLETEELEEKEEYEDFTIKESSDSFSGTSVIPPDLAICDRCLEEINNPNNRRYNYPFNACTDCGPRFTVIENVPYDRDKTTMDDFPLCPECEAEYKNPLDRRYHAEASCCEVCGPSLQLYKNEIKEKTIIDDNGNETTKVERIAINTESKDPLKDSTKLLDIGKILAVKGIGGTHLVANVLLEDSVKLLRKRLNRPNQAFAVMSPDIKTVKEYALVSSAEEEGLLSKERPIIILKKGESYGFAESVSPGLHNIGVMLPYAPLHHLLFNHTNTPAYIMTSANVPGEPMMVTNQEILENLDEIADYYLIHDRRILNRCDDSVIRFRNDELAFIRRSRGYTPEPYDLKAKYTDLNPEFDNLNILALGPELDVTFTILKNSKAYLSQHIGNTNKYRTYEFLQEAIKHMMRITKTDSFDAIACDLHPQFFTTKLAKELAKEYDCPLIQVQHHHAHGISLLNDHYKENKENKENTYENKDKNKENKENTYENKDKNKENKDNAYENKDKNKNSVDIDNLNNEMIIIAADGVGYGSDGNSWGGEILYTNIEEFERLASLMPQKMPGGDLCTKYPVRMLASILSNPNSEYEKDRYSEDYIKELLNENYINSFKHGSIEIKSLFRQLDANLNVGINTSTGRVLDSVSAALNICDKRSYEGEASMKLESYAYNYKENDTLEDFPIIIKDYTDVNNENTDNRRRDLDTTAILRYIVDKIKEGEDPHKIAVAGQKAVSIGLAKLAVESAKEKGIKTIGATGGVFYNEAITSYIKNYIEKEGFNFIQHINSCPGDGSVSLGQAIIAGINLKHL
ncbi:[NiFe] hydrogenase maturation protein HypF [Methanobrevibacter olleyae]|uniref:acylphosphatase n=2 Tax=Methanobrevibacter olleyae TaxID=294671 RepID=A0A126R0Y0_METOL|nr:hydrogenase maturation factor HypF [Methanobrevibacter olleyae]SFL68938.1 [NiFe] hydrogenase maturation protein HypF [Methanobrevibacter olleyae]